MATAQAIDNLIQSSEMANGGNRSPLHGFGRYFLQFEAQYGVNAAVVCAISQRECQLGAAGNDAIVPYNNFGGNACGAVGVTTANGCVNAAGRSWNRYPSPLAGLEGIFQTLNDPLYRNAGPSLSGVINIYSPPSENNYSDLWSIFSQVGNALGETIGPDTNVYTASGKQGFNPISNAASAVGGSVWDSVTGFLQGYFNRGIAIVIGIILIGIAVKSLV